MKVHDIIFHIDDPEFRSSILLAQKNKWLNYVENLSFKSESNLQTISDEFGALTVNELGQQFNGISNAIIITKQPLNDQNHFWTNDHIILISLAKIDKIPLLPFICLISQKWSLKNLYGVSDKVLFEHNNFEEKYSLSEELKRFLPFIKGC